MAVTWVGGAGNHSATAFSVSLPAGWLPGDLAVLISSVDAGTDPGYGLPAGWTLAGKTAATNLYSYVWYRVLQAGDTTIAISNQGTAGVGVWRNAAWAGMGAFGIRSGTVYTVTAPAYASASGLRLHLFADRTIAQTVGELDALPALTYGTARYLYPGNTALGAGNQTGVPYFADSSTGSGDNTATFTDNAANAWGVQVAINDTSPVTTGRPKVNLGAGWVEKPAKVYIGGQWVEKPMKIWDGSAWVKIGDAVPAGATIVGSSYVNQGGSGSTSLPMTLPTGLQTGDRLYVAAITTNTAAGVTVTETLPAGWSAVTAKADVGTMQRALYTAVYTAGLAAPSWALSVATKSAYACVAIRGAATPQEAHADAGGLTSTAPAIASAPVGLGLRFYVRKDNLSTSVTPPAGATLITGALGVATGPSAHILAYSTTQAAAGAMPAAVTTWPVTSVNSTAWTVSV